MTTAAPPIFDRMSALADTTRSRLLLVLERHELTVGEACAVLQLPQSTVSRHLKLLGDEAWVTARAEGTTRRYRMLGERLDPDARALWGLVRGEVSALPAAVQDRQRLRSVLAQRTTQSKAFFSSAAGEWDRLRAELFGRGAELRAVLGLLDSGWTVGDLGCGTAPVSDLLAPFVERVVAVDSSPEMLAAAKKRLHGADNVELREGELESLPLEGAELDAAVASLVLHYVAEPEIALAEVARVLKPGGRLLVVDMMPHGREEYRHAMGHVWLGFEEPRLRGWLEDAGFAAIRYIPLPPDPAAKGPTLFAASAVKKAVGAEHPSA